MWGSSLTLARGNPVTSLRKRCKYPKQLPLSLLISTERLTFQALTAAHLRAQCAYEVTWIQDEYLCPPVWACVSSVLCFDSLVSLDQAGTFARGLQHRPPWAGAGYRLILAFLCFFFFFSFFFSFWLKRVMAWFRSLIFLHKAAVCQGWLGEGSRRSGPWGHLLGSPWLDPKRLKQMSSGLSFQETVCNPCKQFVFSRTRPPKRSGADCLIFLHFNLPIVFPPLFLFANAIFLNFVFCLSSSPSPSPLSLSLSEPQVRSRKNKMSLQWTDQGMKVF